MCSQYVHCSVDDCDDVYLIGLDVIDNSIRPFNNFTDLVKFVLRDFPARKRKVSNLD